MLILAKRSQLLFCHIVSTLGIVVDPIKIEAIVKWQQLKSISEMRSFLGLASYYMRFILGFSSIAAALTQLTRREK